MGKRFEEVGKILLGKRPSAPPMPATSTWVIETNGWSPITVKLRGRIIEERGLGYVGEPFEQLTSTMVHTLTSGETRYARPFKFDLKRVE